MSIESIPEADRFVWGPVPGVPFYALSAGDPATVASWQEHGIGWPESHLLFTGGKRFAWVNRQSDVDRGGLRAARLLLDPTSRLADRRTAYAATLRRLDAAETQITPSNLAPLSRSELAERYHELLALGTEFWQSAIFPELAGYGLSAYLRSQLVKTVGETNADEALAKLAAPNDLSFFQNEERALLGILDDVHPLVREHSRSVNAGGHSGSVGERADEFAARLAREAPRLHHAIADHARRYAWLLGNYASNAPLDERYFHNRARELLAKDKSSAEQIAAIDAAHASRSSARDAVIAQLPESLRTEARALSSFVAWHDDRKANQLRYQLLHHHVLTALSPLIDVDFSDLLMWAPTELASYLDGGPKVGDDVIAERRTIGLVWLRPDGWEWRSTAEAELSAAAYLEAPPEHTKTLRGTVASPGTGTKVIGTVRILDDPTQSHRIGVGDILVASMTSPEFIDAIRRAAAIVTDVGGLTSHAAVVARELGKLCIVGTKHATSFLKDGERVRIDPVTGTIERIEP